MLKTKTKSSENANPRGDKRNLDQAEFIDKGTFQCNNQR